MSLNVHDARYHFTIRGTRERIVFARIGIAILVWRVASRRILTLNGARHFYTRQIAPKLLRIASSPLSSSLSSTSSSSTIGYRDTSIILWSHHQVSSAIAEKLRGDNKSNRMRIARRACKKKGAICADKGLSLHVSQYKSVGSYLTLRAQWLTCARMHVCCVARARARDVGNIMRSFFVIRLRNALPLSHANERHTSDPNHNKRSSIISTSHRLRAGCYGKSSNK